MPRTSIRLAAVLAAAGVAAAACGTVQMGAAAIVGGDRISATTLAGEVANLKAGYQRYGKQVQLQFPASRMAQEVLSWMIRFRVRDDLAAREGITVTPAAAQRALAALSLEIRQSGSTLPEVAVANGLPPNMIPDLGRYQAIQTAALTRIGGGTLPSGSALQSAQNRFSRSECLASKSLGIRVSPQFGTINYKQLLVEPVASTLSAAEGPAPKPSSSAQAAC